MIDFKNDPDIFYQKIFDHIAEKGWRTTTLYELSKITDTPPSLFYQEFQTKTSLVKKFIHFIDQKLLNSFELSDDNPKDQIFDLLMTRFEILEPFKEGVKALYNETVGHLSSTFFHLVPEHLNSLQWMLSLLEEKSKTFLGTFPIPKLSYVYFQTLRIWIWDDTADLNHTLVALDQNLSQIQSLDFGYLKIPFISQLFSFFRKK